MNSNYSIINRRFPFTYIVSGFAITTIASIFENLFGSIYVYALLSLWGIYQIAKGFYLMRNRLRCPFGKAYSFLLGIYAALVIVMIIRGYIIDYPYPWKSFQGAVNAHFFNRTYILCWLMPRITLIPRNEIQFEPIVKVSKIYAWISLICFIVFYRQIYLSSIAQALGKTVETTGISYQGLGLLYVNAAFISLCKKYIPNKIWWLNFIALVISLLILLMSGRRGASAITGVLILLSLYLWVRSKSKLARLFIYPVGMIGLAGIIFYSSQMSAFRFIQERGMEDTRSAVDVSLMKQMSDVQLIFGKGLNGRYYHFLPSNDEYNGWRYMSETGYYHLILKGGYVFVWVYILILLIPSLKGIFDSRNLLSRAFGLYLFLNLLDLYPWGHPTFNFKFMIIWIGVTLCMSRTFRHLSDRQIKQYFFKHI